MLPNFKLSDSNFREIDMINTKENTKTKIIFSWNIIFVTEFYIIRL
jgi:hypothetical protein